MMIQWECNTLNFKGNEDHFYIFADNFNDARQVLLKMQNVMTIISIRKENYFV